MKASEQLVEAIQEILESENMRVYMAVNEILNLLFWKDYSAGYVNLDDKQNLVRMIDKYNYHEGTISDFDGYHKFDNREELKELITKIRGQIGLTEKLP